MSKKEKTTEQIQEEERKKVEKVRKFIKNHSQQNEKGNYLIEKNGKEADDSTPYITLNKQDVQSIRMIHTDNKEDIFYPIRKDFKPRYFITRSGIVLSYTNNKDIKALKRQRIENKKTKKKSEYLSVNTNMKKGQKTGSTYRVHQLVAWTFGADISEEGKELIKEYGIQAFTMPKEGETQRPFLHVHHIDGKPRHNTVNNLQILVNKQHQILEKINIDMENNKIFDKLDQVQNENNKPIVFIQELDKDTRTPKRKKIESLYVLKNKLLTDLTGEISHERTYKEFIQALKDNDVIAQEHAKSLINSNIEQKNNELQNITDYLNEVYEPRYRFKMLMDQQKIKISYCFDKLERGKQHDNQ